MGRGAEILGTRDVGLPGFRAPSSMDGPPRCTDPQFGTYPIRNIKNYNFFIFSLRTQVFPEVLLREHRDITHTPFYKQQVRSQLSISSLVLRSSPRLLTLASVPTQAGSTTRRRKLWEQGSPPQRSTAPVVEFARLGRRFERLAAREKIANT